MHNYFFDSLFPKTINYSPKFNNVNGYSDVYGLNHVLLEYCKLKTKQYIKNVYIAHGTTPPWELFTWPNMVEGLELDSYLVARRDEADFLKNHGKNGLAIGLPIIYLDQKKLNIERLESTLLVMPPHLLDNYYFENEQELVNSYVDFISKYKSSFKHVLVVIHKICFDKGLWVKEFKKIGIDVIVGADKYDKNALYKQAYFFKRFSHVTTPDWGSHVAYALYFGCSVSICGPKFVIPKSLIAQDYNGDLNLVERLFSKKVLDEKLDFLKDLYREPTNSIINKSLGNDLVGLDNKKTKSELRRLLKWKIDYFYYFKVIYSRIKFLF